MAALRLLSDMVNHCGRAQFGASHPTTGDGASQPTTGDNAEVVQSRHSAGHDTGPTYYAEDRCALRWPLYLLGIAPLTLATVWMVLAGTAGQWGLFCVGDVLAGSGLAGLLLLRWNWPTGIRVDAAGIRIGGVRRAERQGLLLRLRRKPVRTYNQRDEVFTCPWDGAWRLAVVSDRHALREMFRQARACRYGDGWGHVTPLGWLSAPFMRAGLVIYVVPGKVRQPPLRSGARERAGALSPTWLVPTRHPGPLWAALARASRQEVHDRIGPDAPVLLYPLEPGGRAWQRATRSR
jgi:hypothetical protein